MMNRRQCAACLAVVFACTTLASGFVAWDTSSGSTEYFNWSNGGSEMGLFGSPMLIGSNTFLFFPTQFRAEAENGATEIKSDTLSFELQMIAPYCLTGIRVVENGDYGVLGDGSSVSAWGEMKLESLINGGSLTTEIAMNPTFPAASGSGSWSGQGQLAGTFCNSVRISVSNELVAISSAGTTAFIEKKLLGSAIAITVIPEPATLLILGLGAIAAVWRRNK